MPTFYLLPARPVLADHLADALAPLLPGLDLTVRLRRRLLEALLDELRDEPDVFLVPRDELPSGQTAETSLVVGYGVGEGDEIIEVRVGVKPGELRSHRWVPPARAA